MRAPPRPPPPGREQRAGSAGARGEAEWAPAFPPPSPGARFPTLKEAVCRLRAGVQPSIKQWSGPVPSDRG